MTAAKAIVNWSETEPSLAVNSAQELDAVLDSIASKCNADTPNAVTIDLHGYEVIVGLGLPQSFVHIEQESGEPPYEITVGDSDAAGVVVFFLHGFHYTEIPRRHLIATTLARRIVREFFEAGRRSAAANWEEV